MNQKLTHVTRLSPPDVTDKVTWYHDKVIGDTLAAILDIDHLPELARTQASIKTSSGGGLGLTSIHDQQHYAFVASWASSLGSLPGRVPSLATELQAVSDGASATTSARALRDSLCILSDSIADFNLSAADLPLAPPKLQSKLGAALDEVHRSTLLQQADQTAKARLLSASCRESGAWLEAVPVTQHHVLTSEEFSSGVLMRLGLPLPVARGLSSCPNPRCTASIDAEGRHLLTCGMGPGRVRLHDRMVRAWHSLILSSGLRATVEQRGLYPDQRRPDIVVPDFEAGKSLHLDFSATHPCLPSNVVASSRSPGAAAAKREREKHSVYSDCDGTLVPLVCEHHGRWGEAATKLLKSLARRAGVSSPQITHAQFVDFWLKSLSCELLRGMDNSVGWNRGSYCIDGLLDAIVCHS